MIPEMVRFEKKHPLGALTWGFICRSGALVCEILRCRDRISVRMIRSLRLVFRKNCIRCGAKQFFASHFLFEQSDRHRVILTDTLCRSGSSGGKGRRKTKQIPKRGRPCGCFFLTDSVRQSSFSAHPLSFCRKSACRRGPSRLWQGLRCGPVPLRAGFRRR